MLAVFQGSNIAQVLCSADWLSAKVLFGSANAKHSRVFCCNAGTRVKDDVNLLATLPDHWLKTKTDGMHNTLHIPEFKVKDGTACELCPSGWSTGSFNIATTCTLAPRNYFVAADGLTIATECDSDSYTNPPETTKCKLCAAGKKMVRGANKTTCDPCGPGFFQDGTGKVDCKSCRIGQYQNTDTLAYCVRSIPNVKLDIHVLQSTVYSMFYRSSFRILTLSMSLSLLLCLVYTLCMSSFSLHSFSLFR